MATVNQLPPAPRTHEGAAAERLTPEQKLRRSVLACLLWESEFYEGGEEIGERIARLTPKVAAERVAALAVEARERQRLRHVPLLLVREMARGPQPHRKLVAATLSRVIQRADELAEFVALYWKDGKQPLSAPVKRGLAEAFGKFDEYALAKYDRSDRAVKLRDVLFLCHARPKDAEQEALWKRLVDGELATPDTWEVALSAGADKREAFERLMRENKLGGLAFLRNLRNMESSGVRRATVAAYGESVRLERVLPFRFLAAARAVPAWADLVESLMFRALEPQPRLPGKTAIVVDNSGSMAAALSAKSDLNRADAAAALAVLVRELAEECVVIGFGTEAAVIANYRGFALADAIRRGPGGGTYTQKALDLAAAQGYDRIIVITDEQSHQVIGPPAGLGYFINIASARNGIGYGEWKHIDGWSEAVLDYVRAVEQLD
jgi:60 kDa SS-A/Ro ribonucleoprotein